MGLVWRFQDRGNIPSPLLIEVCNPDSERSCLLPIVFTSNNLLLMHEGSDQS